MAIPSADEIVRLKHLFIVCRAEGVQQLHVGDVHFVLDALPPTATSDASPPGHKPPRVESDLAPEHVDMADALYGITK